MLLNKGVKEDEDIPNFLNSILSYRYRLYIEDRLTHDGTVYWLHPVIGSPFCKT